MAEKVKVDIKKIDDDIYHHVSGLPNLQELNQKVREMVKTSTYWELHGGTLFSISMALPLHLVGLYLCSSNIPVVFIMGFILLGLCHSTIANRGGHLAAHNALFMHPFYNRVARWFAIEFTGFFSLKAAMQVHIKEHHPYTNIIGLGDSSSWKAPMFSRYLYMFVAPLAIPVLAPILSLKELKGQFLPSVMFIASISAGFTLHVYMIMKISGYTTILGSVCFLFAYRTVTSLSYIHVNIFQHIGLPMFTLKSRPSKVYQMSTGVLNLNRNIILDWVMGHTLVSCHIEHHLYPSLSDDMCLKIQPVVKNFLLSKGLPYHERPYMERLSMFIEKYDELMVKAPPFTHFIGLQ